MRTTVSGGSYGVVPAGADLQRFPETPKENPSSLNDSQIRPFDLEMYLYFTRFLKVCRFSSGTRYSQAGQMLCCAETDLRDGQNISLEPRWPSVEHIMEIPANLSPHSCPTRLPFLPSPLIRNKQNAERTKFWNVRRHQ